MSPKTPKSTISRKAWQKLPPEWYSKRAVFIGWVGNSLDAFVAPCYSRNRTFWGIWWRIQRIYGNIKVLSLKNGSSKCAWDRNNWTVPEWGFRSCHCFRSFSGMRRVWWVWIVAQNQRHIFLLLFWQSAVIDNTLQISGDRELHVVCYWRNIVIVQFLHHSLSFAKVGFSSLEASLSYHCFH